MLHFSYYSLESMATFSGSFSDISTCTCLLSVARMAGGALPFRDCMGTEQCATPNPMVPHLYFRIGVRKARRRRKKSLLVAAPNSQP